MVSHFLSPWDNFGRALDLEVGPGDEKVSTVCTAGDFAALEAVADCLMMSGGE
jgi:hypothetical protein